MNKIIIFAAFLIFAHQAFSQIGFPTADVIVCFDVDHSGFTLVNEQDYNKSFSQLQKKEVDALPLAVSFSGIVESVTEMQPTLLNTKGRKTSVPVIGIEDTDTSERRLEQTKSISLKNIQLADSSSANISAYKKINPRRIYIPKSLGVNNGDYISISNYSAFLNDTCYVGDSGHQKAFIFGNFKVR